MINKITINKNLLSKYSLIMLAIVMSAALILVFKNTNEQAHAQTFQTITNSIDIDSNNENVTRLQTFLASNRLIYPEGLITGYYGPLTQAAVRNFQIGYDSDHLWK